MRNVLVAAGVAAVGLVIGLGVWMATRPSADRDGPSGETVEEVRPRNLIVLGGGPTPELNQVSIEQDVALALDVVGPPAAVLWSGGPDTFGVRVLDDARSAPTLRVRLGGIFAPREGRASRYRKSTLPVTGPATPKALLAVLDEVGGNEKAGSEKAGNEKAGSETVGSEAPPLLLYLAGHGEQGDTAADNRLSLWGRSDLSAAALATALDEVTRPVRVVASMCYSGGFAELAFAGGTPANGATPLDRCGLFAAPWDLVASGCDPDPDRRAQEGFAIHFFNALRGRDRHGKVLPRAAVDFDGDGQISLSEAHARVQIASESADVPTTTSGRWLEYLAPAGGPSSPVDLPEETAIVQTLQARLKMTPAEADSLLASALDRIAEDDQALRDAEAAADRAYQVLAAAMLARWPVIDDPWHPDFEALLKANAAEIERFLDDAPEAVAYQKALGTLDTRDRFLHQQQRRSAQLERFVRAAWRLDAAGRIKARGGSEWETFERLRQCERWVPVPR